jgi:dihydrofolate reductase
MSLDGYIAGPGGEYDWIIMDPAIDFAAFFKAFDTVLMGRRTFEIALSQGSGGGMPGMRAIVFSRTLRAADHPGVTIVSTAAEQAVAALKAEPGKDIWLMGGGVLFRSLLDADLVDTVEVGLIPVLLGRGIPLVETGAHAARLRLSESKALPSGIVMLSYTIERGAA